MWTNNLSHVDLNKFEQFIFARSLSSAWQEENACAGELSTRINEDSPKWNMNREPCLLQLFPPELTSFDIFHFHCKLWRDWEEMLVLPIFVNICQCFQYLSIFFFNIFSFNISFQNRLNTDLLVLPLCFRQSCLFGFRRTIFSIKVVHSVSDFAVSFGYVPMRFVHPHMGQFLQGGKNGRLMSFFF